ncbi:MAG: SCO family protein [Imperialibacter sp.]|uniref:SCO family protein n=1 Tax=Imperialibacter sp. TaxID=2038411 RepID=UPI0032F0149C
MKKLIFSVLMVASLGACANFGGEKKLPILGRREVTTVEIDGVTTADTIYHTIADFRFLDQDSAWVTNETYNGKIYVADFFFTSCPTICPIMKTQMIRIYETFESNPEVGLLSYSIDPEHDTVAVLHDFAERLGVKSDKWHFVTGDKDAIYDLGETSYMVVAGEDPDAPGGYIHSGAFLLVDKGRRIRGVYDGTVEEAVNELMEDMKILLKEYNKEKS